MGACVCFCVRCVQLRDIFVFMIACGYSFCMFASMLVNVSLQVPIMFLTIPVLVLACMVVNTFCELLNCFVL